MHDNRHSFSPDGDLKFTIVDGEVTAIERVIGSYVLPLPLPSGASFTVADGTVTETLTRGATTATLIYTADADDTTVYHLSQEIKTVDGTGAEVADESAATVDIVGLQTPVTGAIDGLF